MTILHKPVERIFKKGSIFDRRGVVITLDPGGYLQMREKGCRTVYQISYEALYFLLCRMEKSKEKAGAAGRRRTK